MMIYLILVIGVLIYLILIGYKMSKFIISLDFELHWGVFDTLGRKYDKNILGARESIRGMLELFDKYEISVTWAIVGLLFNKNKEEYKKYKPDLLPSYNDNKLSSYNVEVGEDESEDNLHYAHTIISLINSYPNQEIASHTYSHYYTNSVGQTSKEFDKDIQSATKICMDKLDIKLKSFIFPKNEINEHYLDILSNYGFTSYRGNPYHWIYKNGQETSIIGRIIRMLDSYINITGYNCSELDNSNKLTNIVGNRFLRPYKNSILNFLMLRRIKKEMIYSAINNKNYHLWWHPHNFGVKTKENLNNLDKILSFYKELNFKYNMISVSMKDL